MIKKIMKIFAKDEELNRAQDNIISTINEIINTPIITGNLIENIVFSGAGSKSVEHKLGRKWSGYFIIKRSAAVTIYDDGNPSDTFLNLTSSGAATISLWVF